MGDNNSSNDTNLDKQSPTLDTATSQSAVDLEQGTHTATTPVHLPIQEPSHGKKPLILTLVTIVVLLLIGGGAYYFMTATKPTDTATTTATTPSPSTSPSTAVIKDAKTLVENQIKPLLKAKIATIDKASTSATSGLLSTGQSAYEAAYYQTKGHTFSNSPLVTSGIASTGTKTEAAADYKTVTDFLGTKNFKSLSTSDDTPGSIYSAWASDTVVCSVQSIDLLATTAKAVVTGIACADTTSYEASAKAIEPLYNAYTASDEVKKNPTSIDRMLISSPKIGDSSNSYGYKTASMQFGVADGVGGAVLLFYQEQGKDWTFFMGTQEVVPCKYYTTTTLKKAYADYDCLVDTASDKTVKVSTLL